MGVGGGGGDDEGGESSKRRNSPRTRTHTQNTSAGAPSDISGKVRASSWCVTKAPLRNTSAERKTPSNSRYTTESAGVPAGNENVFRYQDRFFGSAPLSGLRRSSNAASTP
jgi:hypothetical protein